MAKRAVQKYKTNRSRSKTRYSSYKRGKINKLEGMAEARMHTYKKANDALKAERQKKVLDKAKVKKVKA